MQITPPNTKRALITGITGQDGSYLAELLLEKGYEVHGMVRITSTEEKERIEHIKDKVFLHYGDLSDQASLMSLIDEVYPHEVYNLGALTHVGQSFKNPLQYGDVTGLGVLRLLEAIRTQCPSAKFYQASTSELFGTESPPQSESSKFHPRSPYGVAKLYGYWITVNYRESYGMFACNGILFNHESPRRGENFVTKKIVRQLSEIYRREREFIELGNLYSKRDWGHAKDYVRGMYLMLQQDKPDDFVLSTGDSVSVREFVEMTAKHLDFEIEWFGNGLEEVGVDKKTGKTIVKINPEFYRPAEVNYLWGNSQKAHDVLGWVPEYDLEDLVIDMIKDEFKLGDFERFNV